MAKTKARDLPDIVETYTRALADARGGKLTSGSPLLNGFGKLSFFALAIAGGATAFYFLRHNRTHRNVLHQQLTDELSRRDGHAIDMNIAS